MIHIKNQVAGKYKFRKLVEGEVTWESDWMDNLITNNGLDFFGTQVNSVPMCGSCYVGTGNTTPTVSDTTLTTYLANTQGVATGTQSFVSGTPSYYTNTFTYTFATGVATGTISEVGVGITTNSIGPVYTLFSHALIVDSLGSPTTITILSNESLQVLYQLQLYNDTTTNTYSVVIAGVTYTGSYLLYAYGTRALTTVAYSVFESVVPNSNQTFPQTAFFNGTIGTITATSPSGTRANSGNVVTMSSYSSGTYTVTYTFTMNLAYANLSGGISAFTVDYAMAAYQFSVSPAIPKDSNHILTLQIAVSWARYP